MSNLTLQEWIDRCAARFVKVTGIKPEFAMDSAQACADAQADSNGASMVAWDPPEDAADEEMACWDDDGE